MTPAAIAKKEAAFAKNLTSNKGTKFTVKKTTDIGDGVTITSIRPGFDDYYYGSVTEKKSICLHFTVGYIMSDIDALATSNNHVSVSYLVDRSGHIYELFPDICWSYHLGAGTIGGNAAMSKQSIGIEISNYGPLSLSGNNMVDAYKNTYCSKADTQYYEKFSYRGNDYYATMSDVQMVAVEHLIKYLCRTHNIPLDFRSNDCPFGSEQEALGFSGIFYHTNVRKDKFDWPFYDPIKKLIADCVPTVDRAPASDVQQASNEESTAEPVSDEAVPVETAVSTVKSEPSTEVKTKTNEVSEKKMAKHDDSLLEILINILMNIFGK